MMENGKKENLMDKELNTIKVERNFMMENLKKVQQSDRELLQHQMELSILDNGKMVFQTEKELKHG